MTISYEVLPGGAILEKYMAGVADRAADMAPAFEGVLELFHDITADRFNSQGEGSWPPLADATMNATGLWARDNQNFEEILQNTMVLYDSLMGSGTNAVVEIDPDGVLWGTADSIAHWHQNGGTRLHASGAGWPPQRKIVDLSLANREEIVQICFRYLLYGVWE